MQLANCNASRIRQQTSVAVARNTLDHQTPQILVKAHLRLRKRCMVQDCLRSPVVGGTVTDQHPCFRFTRGENAPVLFPRLPFPSLSLATGFTSSAGTKVGQPRRNLPYNRHSASSQRFYTARCRRTERESLQWCGHGTVGVVSPFAEKPLADGAPPIGSPASPSGLGALSPRGVHPLLSTGRQIFIRQ